MSAYTFIHQPRSFHRTKSQTILPPTFSFFGHLYIYIFLVLICNRNGKTHGCQWPSSVKPATNSCFLFSNHRRPWNLEWTGMKMRWWTLTAMYGLVECANSRHKCQKQHSLESWRINKFYMFFRDVWSTFTCSSLFLYFPQMCRTKPRFREEIQFFENFFQ